MERRINPIIAKNTSEIAKSIFDYFFDGKHSIYSAISGYIEILRVASSIVICVSI